MSPNQMPAPRWFRALVLALTLLMVALAWGVSLWWICG